MTTHSSKIEVIWSPNKEEDFATYGTELRLYTVQELGAQVRRALAGPGAGVYVSVYIKMQTMCSTKINVPCTIDIIYACTCCKCPIQFNDGSTPDGLETEGL